MRSRKSSGVLQLLKPPSTTLKRNNEFQGKKLKNKPKTRKLEKKKKKKEYKMKQWRMFLLQGLNSWPKSCQCRKLPCLTLCTTGLNITYGVLELIAYWECLSHFRHFKEVGNWKNYSVALRLNVWSGLSSTWREAGVTGTITLIFNIASRSLNPVKIMIMS